MQSIGSFLRQEFLGQDVWVWLVFVSIVVALLAFDLGVLHRKQREISASESLWLSAAYTAVALAFGSWVWLDMGRDAGMAYLTGFFIEKSLALDNVFVISLIFGYLAIPARYQHRVLFWGILGVVVMRGIMIALGAALISQFAWVLFVFGAFLIVTGIKMLVIADAGGQLKATAMIDFLKRHLRVTERTHEDRFFVRLPDGDGRVRWFATPLLLALAMVEFADLVFAIDSVPAIFAVTTDPYLVYTSNIFAILGLRALYFALAAMVHRFHYLKYALALVLVFIGAKIFWNQIVGKVDPAVSLAVTATLLAGGILVSLAKTRRSYNREVDAPAE